MEDWYAEKSLNPLQAVTGEKSVMLRRSSQSFVRDVHNGARLRTEISVAGTSLTLSSSKAKAASGERSVTGVRVNWRYLSGNSASGVRSLTLVP